MKLFIQEAAEQDILKQVDWYAERGLTEVARRFFAATRQAFDALVATPAIGAPRSSPNVDLIGLRAWPLPGFQQFRAYYIDRPELLIIIRVLHGMRNTEAILANQLLQPPYSN